MKALKKQQIAVILVLSVILSTFAAVTPVSAATLSAQQYLEKMGIAVRNLKSYDFTQTTDQKMTMEGQIIQNKTVVKQSVYNSPLKVKSVTDTTTVLAGMSSKNQAVAYLTKDADGLLWEYISSNGSGYQKTGILNYTNQIKGMDISIYSDGKNCEKENKSQPDQYRSDFGACKGLRCGEIFGPDGNEQRDQCGSSCGLQYVAGNQSDLLDR